MYFNNQIKTPVALKIFQSLPFVSINLFLYCSIVNSLSIIWPIQSGFLIIPLQLLLPGDELKYRDCLIVVSLTPVTVPGA